jgi:hypothetical protein
MRWLMYLCDIQRIRGLPSFWNASKSIRYASRGLIHTCWYRPLPISVVWCPLGQTQETTWVINAFMPGVAFALISSKVTGSLRFRIRICNIDDPDYQSKTGLVAIIMLWPLKGHSDLAFSFSATSGTKAGPLAI